MVENPLHIPAAMSVTCGPVANGSRPLQEEMLMPTMTEEDVLARPHYAYPVTAEATPDGWGVRIAGELMSVRRAREFAAIVQIAALQATHMERHPGANQSLLEAVGFADAARTRARIGEAAERAL
jgi:hypothetical protein